MEVKILKQDHFGNGLTKINDKTVFIKKALKDELCEIEITNDKKNFSEGRITKIVEESQERENVICPYYEKCGGCSILHQKYNYQAKFKEEKVKELLERFTNFKGKVESIKTTEKFNYRNKVTLKVHNNKLAYNEEKSNNLISIENCLLLPNKMNELINKINLYLTTEINFTSIMIHINKMDEFLISLTGNLNKDVFLEYIKEFNVHSIFLNDKLIYGDNNYQESLFDMKFYLNPKSFFQVNRNQTEILYSLVLKEVEKAKPNLLLDLYCGTGTIGLLASRNAQKVIGIEVVESAIINANQNKKLNNIDNIEFYNSKVEDIIEKFKNVDFVIVDPPRRGLDDKTREVLLSLKAEVICYVSCDPATLARDLNELQKLYEIEKVTPVDMFPNTYHVETVAVLKLKNKN